MSPETRSYEADHAFMMNCMMYGYIPTDLFRDTAPDASDADASLRSVNPASADAPYQRQSFNIAWVPMILALVVGVIGIASAVTNPPMAGSLSQEFKLNERAIDSL